jgi:hypothetical protein
MLLGGEVEFVTAEYPKSRIPHVRQIFAEGRKPYRRPLSLSQKAALKNLLNCRWRLRPN